MPISSYEDLGQDHSSQIQLMCQLNRYEQWFQLGTGLRHFLWESEMDLPALLGEVEAMQDSYGLANLADHSKYHGLFETTMIFCFILFFYLINWAFLW